MNLGDLSEGDREDYLRSFGVDPEYFGIKEYNLGQLRSAKDEVARCIAKLTESFEKLYEDLNITVEVQYREPIASAS